MTRIRALSRQRTYAHMGTALEDILLKATVPDKPYTAPPACLPLHGISASDESATWSHTTFHPLPTPSCPAIAAACPPRLCAIFLMTHRSARSRSSRMP